MTKKYEGACLCGGVKFEVEGEFNHFFLCHCSRCRMTSGSAHGANLFSKTAKLNWLQGEDLIETYAVPDTRFVTTFCKKCGSKLPKDFSGKIIQVPAGAISSDLNIRPTAHIFADSRADWDDDLEGVQSFPDMLPRTK